MGSTAGEDLNQGNRMLVVSARCQRLKPSAGIPNTLKRVAEPRETRFNGFCLSDAGFNPRRKSSMRLP